MLTSCLKSFLPARDTTDTASMSTASSWNDEKPSLHHLDHPARVGQRYRPLSLSDAAGRLRDLRKEMEEAKIDAYVVPTADAHGSEYVGDCDKRRSWLSGFTGSAGVAIVTRSPDRALLFTDSRYYTQASQELDTSLWSLQKVGLKDVKQWNQWLVEEGNLDKGSKVGIDPTAIDYSTAIALSKQLSQSGLSLVYPSQGNLVDRIWGDARPTRAAKPIKDHPLHFAGKSSSDKLSDLRTWLEKRYPGVEGSPTPSFLLTSLPPIAWLLNLRGQDIAFNPVFYGYLLVRPATAQKGEKVILWVQKGAVTEDVRKRVEEELGGRVEEYGDAIEGLGRLAKEGGEKVVADGKVSVAVAEALGNNFLPLPAGTPNPVDTAQAIKNPVEIAGFRAAYLRDGLAWVRWLAWLEEELTVKKKKVTEWDAAERLTKYREAGENFAGLAYENISATGPNAALPHYEPSPDHPTPISLDSPYLNDSGAQYLDGTIDTTRTYLFHPAVLSSPSRVRGFMAKHKTSPVPPEIEEYKRAFTRVLQGHIAIDKLVFPEGTTGEQVDVLARWRLWGEGMDYGHGTGHGVGEYLSVHETQMGISHSAAYFNTPFLPGHITSNEPAVYFPGKGGFGIRIESVLCVKEVDPSVRAGPGMRKQVVEGDEKKWYGFERLTTVPIQSSLVSASLLTPEERTWLEKHNQTCKDMLLPLLKKEKDERAISWLKRQ
ncbi:hypothetical protein JCM11251_000607 [Rhodosporidiobolus azoricus]